MQKLESAIEDIMVSASRIKDGNKVGAEKLIKVWRIDYKNSQRMLGVTSQRHERIDKHSLVRSYSTNDRMLKCKTLDEYFFMGAFL